MTLEKLIPSVVEVNFLIPGAGSEIQTYSLLSPHDLFLWRANEKLTAAIQTRITTVESIPATEENMKRIKDAHTAGKKLFEKIKNEYKN